MPRFHCLVPPLVAVALCASVFAHAELKDVRLAAKSLASGGERFIERRDAAGVDGFVNIAADRRVRYSPGAIEIHPRGAGNDSVLRYEFAAARPAAPEGVAASGLTYNFYVGPPERWAQGLRSFRQVAYRGLWTGIDATYSGDAEGIKYHFDVAPGADAKKAVFIVRGAQSARIAKDGSVEWTIGSRTLRDERPVAFQSSPQGDRIVPAEFTLESAGPDSWKLGFKLGDYDRSRALTIDPAFTAMSGLVGGNAADQVHAVARDSSGNSYACGATTSTNLPVANAHDTSANGAEDAFLVKFNSSGNAQFVTYFGGEGFDACTALALSSSAIYVAGGTKSTQFPFLGTGDASFRRAKASTDRDAFVARFSTLGVLVFSGVIGGTLDDQAHGIALDPAGDAYVTGYAKGTGFPYSAPAGPFTSCTMCAFVARISADGTTTRFSRSLLGNGSIQVGHAIAVDGGGNAFVVGETNATAGLPSMSGTFRTIAGTGDGDAFVARVSATGADGFFTLLAGTATGTETGVDRALGVAHESGSLAVVGETDSANFPANNAGTRMPGNTGTPLQAGRTGNMDGFVVRMDSNGTQVTSASYIGGARYDSAEAVAFDGVGGLFVAGTASAGSAGFPTLPAAGLVTTAPGQQDGFIARIFSSNGSTWSGFLGGSLHDSLRALAASSDRVLAVGGATLSTGLPNLNASALGAESSSINGVVFRVNTEDPATTSPRSGFNGDARSDVFWRDATDGLNYQWQMNGLAISGQGFMPSVPTNWSVAGLGDTNNDGFSDVLWRSTTGQVYLWLMNGFVAPTQGYMPSVPSAWTVAGLGDVSGDGKADVVWRNASTGDNYLWIMDGLGITSQGYLPNVAGADWEPVSVADHSGDGKADVFWRNKATGQNYLWIMDGLSIAGQGFLPVLAAAWEVKASPNADGNAAADIFWRNRVTGENYLWLMNGLAVAAEGALPTVSDANWKVATYGDYNGDGRGDIFWRHATTGQNYLWLLNGLSVASQGFMPDVGGANWMPVK